MTCLYLHIGPETAGAARLQEVLASKRDNLRTKGVLVPRATGNRNATRLFMAITDPEHIDPLRHNRGHADPARQAKLRAQIKEDLAREIAQSGADTVILSCAQLGTSLHRVSELERLRDLLTSLVDEIRIIFLLDTPARLMLGQYALQLGDGRATPLSREIGFAPQTGWWSDCLRDMPAINPQAGRYEETDGAPFWLDFPALQRHWEQVFGAGSVAFHRYDPVTFASAEAPEALARIFPIPASIGRVSPVDVPTLPSAATMARQRAFNAALQRLLAHGKHHVPRQLLHKFHAEMAVGGVAPEPGTLNALTRRFEGANALLSQDFPELGNDWYKASGDESEWIEPDPQFGFRASQYLLAFLYRIEKATQADTAKLAKPPSPTEEPAQAHEPSKAPAHFAGLDAAARALMPSRAVENLEKLQTSSFAPHNRLGAIDETQLGPAYTEVPPRALTQGRSGNVIVGCMKNEAPYIVEWVAYHRAMGVDNFLIYTNDCTDGTSEILDRLQALGVLEHRNNDNWKGNSPQQYALNQALKEPVIRNADWLIHIDVDEFINVRTGNGTLQDFFDAAPEATNVAMTWRLFGHNGVTRLADDFVIDQFDACAPKFCPKPHTVWGFKTMFRNIGAYEKISCHRPNKLDDSLRPKVRWVNGSGSDMTAEAVDNGWRNSKKSIGYDLIQLNHYALRSAESFLIKRQRGRALHVDRSIGLNYWIRMDWCDYRDITIKRNLPRLRAEYDRLMQDDTLRHLHETGLDWHRAKAQELHAMPEFEELYQQALAVKLSGVERVAYALALDLES